MTSFHSLLCSNVKLQGEASITLYSQVFVKPGVCAGKRSEPSPGVRQAQAGFAARRIFFVFVFC